MGLLYACKSCGNLWESRKRMGAPSRCPKCSKRNITNKDIAKYYKNPYS